jgi:glutaredoxin
MVDSIILYGAEYCPFCYMAKEYLDSKNISYTYKDITTDDEAHKELMDNIQERNIPVLVSGSVKIVGFKQSEYEKLITI